MHKLFLLLLIIVLSEKNFSQSVPDTIPITLPEAETSVEREAENVVPVDGRRSRAA